MHNKFFPIFFKITMVPTVTVCVAAVSFGAEYPEQSIRVAIHHFEGIGAICFFFRQDYLCIYLDVVIQLLEQMPRIYFISERTAAPFAMFSSVAPRYSGISSSSFGMEITPKVSSGRP